MLKKSQSTRHKTSSRNQVDNLSIRNQSGSRSFYVQPGSRSNSTSMEFSKDQQGIYESDLRLSLADKLRDIRNVKVQNKGHNGSNSLSLTAKKVSSKSDYYRSIGYYSPAEKNPKLNKKMSTIDLDLSDNGLGDKESEEDVEIAQKIEKLQNEINIFGASRPGCSTPIKGQLSPVKFSNFLEIVSQLREIIHKLQYRDVIRKQEIASLKKNNKELQRNIYELEQKCQELERTRQLDIQCVIKADNSLRKEGRIRTRDSVSQDKLPILSHEKISEIKEMMSNLDYKISELAQEKTKLQNMVNNIVEENNKTLREDSFHLSNYNSVPERGDPVLNSTMGSPTGNLERIDPSYNSVPNPDISVKRCLENHHLRDQKVIPVHTVTMSDIENFEEANKCNNSSLGNTDIPYSRDSKQEALEKTNPFQPGEKNSCSNSKSEAYKEKRSQSLQQPDSSGSSAQRIGVNNGPNTHHLQIDKLTPKAGVRFGVSNRSSANLSPSYSNLFNMRHSNQRSRDIDISHLKNVSPAALEIISQYKQYLSDPVNIEKPSDVQQKSDSSHGRILASIFQKARNLESNTPKQGEGSVKDISKESSPNKKFSESILPESGLLEEVTSERNANGEGKLFSKYMKSSIVLQDLISNSSLRKKVDSVHIENKRDIASLTNIGSSSNRLNISMPTNDLWKPGKQTKFRTPQKTKTPTAQKDISKLK